MRDKEEIECNEAGCATDRRTETQIDKVRDQEEIECNEASCATDRRTEAQIDK